MHFSDLIQTERKNSLIRLIFGLNDANRASLARRECSGNALSRKRPAINVFEFSEKIPYFAGQGVMDVRGQGSARQSAAQRPYWKNRIYPAWPIGPDGGDRHEGSPPVGRSCKSGPRSVFLRRPSSEGISFASQKWLGGLFGGLEQFQILLRYVIRTFIRFYLIPSLPSFPNRSPGNCP